MVRLELLVLACLAIYQVHGQGSPPHVTCPRTFSKLGCFQEKATSMDMMVNDRDRTSPYYQGYFLNWKEFKESVHSLACRCAAKAKSLGYAYIAIRFWGECYAGKSEADLAALLKNDGKKSNQCVNPKFATCVDSDEDECVGKASADYIYSLITKSDINVNGGYAEWSEYSACSSTCGNGIQTRERTCTNPVPRGSGKDCTELGESTDTRTCKTIECPVNGGFTPWTEYEECDKSCGGGTQTRTRSCTDPAPAHGGEECHGPTSENKECNPSPCPVDGGYGSWSDYGACSASCGPGTQESTRQCNNPAPAHGGRNCASLGAALQTQNCEVRKCPVHGNYGPWGAYSACSVTCGGGFQVRSRQCNNPTPAHGGDDCTKLGPGEDKIECNMQICPVDGGYGEWTEYGACSATCGAGTQESKRDCNNPAPAHGGKNCANIGPALQTRNCEVRKCPVHGNYGPWGAYSACSVTCGGGFQVRSRQCNNPTPAHGGDDCTKHGPSEDRITCNTQGCPVDGGYGPWSEFGACSATCGAGTQQSTRVCNSPIPANGGKDCAANGAAIRTQNCEVRKCPVDGGYGDWTEYGACSATCGAGTQESKRDCNNPAPAHGGRNCASLGPALQTRSCEVRKCPVNGGYGAWGEYNACSVTCGGGLQSRSRQCNNPTPAHGGEDCTKLGPSEERITCNTQGCPVDGGYGPWSEYGACSATCGAGNQQSTRVCNSPIPANGGKDCAAHGAAIRTQNCEVRKCPVDGGYGTWTDYGACSATCGPGTQESNRECNNPAPAHGGRNCANLGPALRTQACEVRKCPVNGGYGAWGAYSACSVTCGGGFQTRSRQCNNPTPAHGGTDCTRLGPSEERITCNTQGCPVDGGYGSWTSFGACSTTCGEGVQHSTRECSNPAPANGGKNCASLGPTMRSQVCEVRKCPENGGYGPWSGYTACTVSCGGGQQWRSRLCNNPAPAHGGSDCSRLGPSEDRITCNMQTCPPRYGPEINNMVCEWARVELNCADGVIEVISANYGRTSRIYCGYLDWWQLNCRASTSSSKMAELCNGRKSCIVQAANSVFGDPCVGTVKYLEVTHRCKFAA